VRTGALARTTNGASTLALASPVTCIMLVYISSDCKPGPGRRRPSLQEDPP
jgi:hypothetical protein